MNCLHCDTSPSLHIEAARIVGFPSGTPSAEFLIANFAFEQLSFIVVTALSSAVKKELSQELQPSCGSKLKLLIPLVMTSHIYKYSWVDFLSSLSSLAC